MVANGRILRVAVRAFASNSPSSAAPGPLQLYNERIKVGTILPDDHQKTVVSSLQRVYDDFGKYSIPKPTKSFFSFFSSKKQKIVAPKGLYVFGSVGGGKTMLMDLFFDTVQVIRFNYIIISISTTT